MNATERQHVESLERRLAWLASVVDGIPRRPMTLAQRQADYEYERDVHGVTVEEYEAARSLPAFAVYPAARAARGAKDDGWFMYADREAIFAEEDREIRCLARLGIAHAWIAERYGCDAARVSRCAAGSSRKIGRPRTADTPASLREAWRRASEKYRAAKAARRAA